MTIDTNKPQSTPPDYNPSVDVSASGTGDTAVVTNEPPPIVDTTEQAEANADKQQQNYTNKSGTPSLPPPIVGSIDETLIDQMFNQQKFIEFLKNSDSTNPTDQQHKEELALVKVDDPEIVALAAKLGISPGEAQEKLRITSMVYFKQLIKNMPEDQQNQLLFAQMNPTSAEKLSPELKALLKEINQSINKALVLDMTGYGFSDSWPGVTQDPTEFNNTITGEFDAAFEKALTKMTLGEQITPQQALNLRTMHYMPGSFANDATLQALFSHLEGSVVAGLRAKYGADADWAPKADTSYLRQVSDGFFRQTFQAQLKAYQPPLTQAQQEEIMNLFANPGMAASSAEIEKIAKTITTASIDATIKKFGLESTWMPAIAPITNPQINNKDFQLANDAFTTANGIYLKFSSMVNNLADGPIKAAYLDYLKVIGEALNKLQEFLYALSSTDAATSKKLSKANMDTTLADIQRAQKQVDEAKAKEADTKKLDLGPLGDINNWVGQLISLAVSICIAVAAGIILSPAVGILIAAMAIAYFVEKANAAATGKTSLFDQMFSEINKTLDPGGAGAVTGLLSLVMSGGNPFLFLSMTSDAKTIQNVIKACGGDLMAQELGAAIFNGLAQVIIMAVLMFATGGAAAPAVIAQITATIAKVLHTSVKTINTALYLTSLAFTLAMGALQATQQGLQCQWELVQAEIGEILSKSEAASEEVKTLIRALRKLIDKMLEAMQGISEDIVLISKTQSKKYTDASAITTDLQG